MELESRFVDRLLSFAFLPQEFICIPSWKRALTRRITQSVLIQTLAHIGLTVNSHIILYPSCLFPCCCCKTKDMPMDLLLNDKHEEEEEEEKEEQEEEEEEEDG